MTERVVDEIGATTTWHIGGLDDICAVRLRSKPLGVNILVHAGPATSVTVLHTGGPLITLQGVPSLTRVLASSLIHEQSRWTGTDRKLIGEVLLRRPRRHGQI